MGGRRSLRLVACCEEKVKRGDMKHPEQCQVQRTHSVYARVSISKTFFSSSQTHNQPLLIYAPEFCVCDCKAPDREPTQGSDPESFSYLRFSGSLLPSQVPFKDYCDHSGSAPKRPISWSKFSSPASLIPSVTSVFLFPSTYLYIPCLYMACWYHLRHRTVCPTSSCFTQSIFVSMAPMSPCSRDDWNPWPFLKQISLVPQTVPEIW